jgi:flagellar basal-body rod protein FlgF
MQELAVLASRVMTKQREFTAVADNVANVNTQGYRKLEMEFRETISRPRAHATASYVEDRALHVSQMQGGMETTGNQLDMAINGEGFFAVDVGGTRQYTRRGQFLVNPEGTLVTPEGNGVLDSAGQPIQVPAGAAALKMAEDGTLSTSDGGQFAQIGVFTFSDTDLPKLERAGNTAFVPMLGATALPMESPRLKQGALESSNVNAVQEMVNMQNVSRAYESSIRMMKSLEDLESRAIRNLTVQ